MYCSKSGRLIFIHSFMWDGLFYHRSLDWSISNSSFYTLPHDSGRSCGGVLSLRKHTYSNILKISPPKTESLQIKILIFFIFLLNT